MKRYSISTCEDGYKFYSHGHTDYPEIEINNFKYQLSRWQEELNNETNPYRHYTNHRRGLRIKDTLTKEIIFEEIHNCEEFGWTVVYKEVQGSYGPYMQKAFIKI